MQESLNTNEINKIDLVLQKHGLKKTNLRKMILMTFMKANGSLTQANLIEQLSEHISNFDRASIYRNLSCLKEAGVLHEVEVNNYVYCSHECDAHAHLLLYCKSCNKHQEIKNHSRIEEFVASLDVFQFFGKTKPLFIKGVCKQCSINH